MILSHRAGVMIACDSCPEHRIVKTTQRPAAEREVAHDGWRIDRDRRGAALKHICPGCVDDLETEAAGSAGDDQEGSAL